MYNIAQHLSHQPVLRIYIIISCLIILFSLPYFIRQRRLYGSLFEFASRSRMIFTGGSSLVLIALFLYILTPYVAPAGKELAIIIGNTNNTPVPSISGDISDAIVGTMLQHKGDKIKDLVDAIKIISAVKNPEVVSLEPSELKLEKIGNNKSNAERAARSNVQEIEKKISSIGPRDNGANYMEAIMKARDNVKNGSKIIVIGSGLSDSGDLNFSKSNILTNEKERNDAIKKITEKYSSKQLENYEIVFYGLGDTASPQESLSSIQKEIVRETYTEIVRRLGGEAKINTKTQAGPPAEYSYLVGTTDTGCGDIGFVFDDNDLKFVGNQANYVDKTAALNSLGVIIDAWKNNNDAIKLITIDGYIAHFPGVSNLSQERADTVMRTLVDAGVPPAQIVAKGQGFGPHEQDAQNRIVKVNIARNNDQCKN